VDRYLLESGAGDGYLLEDGTGVLILEPGVTNLAGTLDQLVITELQATVSLSTVIQATTDALSITERFAQRSTGYSAGLAFFTITERTAAIGINIAMSASADSLVITEGQAGVGLNQSFSATLDALMLSEQAAEVRNNISLAALTDALVLTELASTVASNRDILATLESLILSTYVADIPAMSGNSVASKSSMGAYMAIKRKRRL